MGIMDIFGKKPAPIEKEPEIQRHFLRGPNGKFVSQKAKTSPGIIKSTILKSSTFRGIPIRRFYAKDKWFFCVEDVITLTEAPNVKSYLEQIKNKHKELPKNWQKFSYQAKDKSEVLECAEAKDILKIVLSLDKPLPGPFSRWLKEMAQRIPA